MLLVRSSDLSPIYEIREGGEARSIRVKSPNSFAIEHFIPSEVNWMFDFRKGFDGETDTIYEVSPETGESLGQYRIRSKEGARIRFPAYFKAVTSSVFAINKES